jgi:hypothetical protein
MWMAPNLITVLGLIVNIVTTLLYVYNAPQAKEEVTTNKQKCNPICSVVFCV